MRGKQRAAAKNTALSEFQKFKNLSDAASVPQVRSNLNVQGYTLPTASTTVLGGAKIDGTTITIAGGVISGAAPYSQPMGYLSVGTYALITGQSSPITAGYTYPGSTFSQPGSWKAMGGNLNTASGSGTSGAPTFAFLALRIS